MHKLKYILISLPFYLTAALGIALDLIAMIHPSIIMDPKGKVALLGMLCLLIYIGSRILCKAPSVNANRVMKASFLLFFAMYLRLLLSFTLFDPMFGRYGTANFIFSDQALLEDYLANSFNIIPFATVTEYVKAFADQSMKLSAVVTNLFGNLAALAPMALFLPMFIRKCNHLKYFLLFTAGVVVLIELLQMIFATGSCDIDDLILNVAGAAAAFALLKTKSMQKLMKILIPTKSEA